MLLKKIILLIGVLCGHMMQYLCHLAVHQNKHVCCFLPMGDVDFKGFSSDVVCVVANHQTWGGKWLGLCTVCCLSYLSAFCPRAPPLWFPQLTNPCVPSWIFLSYIPTVKQAPCLSLWTWTCLCVVEQCPGTMSRVPLAISHGSWLRHGHGHLITLKPPVFPRMDTALLFWEECWLDRNLGLLQIMTPPNINVVSQGGRSGHSE